MVVLIVVRSHVLIVCLVMIIRVIMIACLLRRIHAAEVVRVRKSALSASQESGALWDHGWCESELLAVENEHITHFR